MKRPDIISVEDFASQAYTARTLAASDGTKQLWIKVDVIDDSLTYQVFDKQTSTDYKFARFADAVEKYNEI